LLQIIQRKLRRRPSPRKWEYERAQNEQRRSLYEIATSHSSSLTESITSSTLSFVARSNSIREMICKIRCPLAWVLDKQSRAGHAFQFAHLRCLFCSRRHRLLEHAFVERAEKFPRDRKLHFLRRVEPAIRGAPLLHDGNGFLAWQTNGQGQRAPFAPLVAGWQR